MPTPEHALAAALDTLPAPVTLWWRDDDAGRDDPRLHRLLALAGERRVALALAVVPEWLDAEAATAITVCPWATVLQHGIAHANHARDGEKRIELGGSAETRVLENGLRAGQERLRCQFGGRFVPVLVPPWNRIAPDLVHRLPALGFRGLSRFGPRAAAAPVSSLVEINTHVDLILWREGRRPMTLAEIVAALTAALRYASEPIGLLSHHLTMDQGAFLALDRILALLQDHPKTRFAGAHALFGEVK